MLPSLLLFVLFDDVETRFAVSLLVGVVYNGVLDGSEAGQTIGKRVARIRTIDVTTGGPLGTPRGLGRAGVTSLFQYLGLAVPLAGLLELADILWPLWDPQRQSLHDKAAGSAVVRVEDRLPVVD